MSTFPETPETAPTEISPGTGPGPETGDTIDLDALAEAYERGLAAEKAGATDEAVAAYAEALALDPHDRGGVAVRLAALGLAEPPAAAPPAYVATLFDQTAERFDDILVEQLGYAVPLLLRERLGDLGIGPVGRMLDLGCGTGLAAESLAGLAGHVTGVDLSEGMLAEADERGGYDELYVGEAVSFVAGWDEAPFDLVVATDMLPYLGAVEALLAGVAGCLAPGGLFGFSTETLAAEAFAGRGWTVGPGQRYAHEEGYLRGCLAEAGFAVLSLEPITVRHNEGRPVPGHLVIARLGPA